ncbi:MAG: aquaporin [Acholeplasmatales bacterium]|nr:aquaporin [Acholeplasmatales bacterium]
MFGKYGKKLVVEATGTAMLTAIACGVAYAAGGTINVSLAFGLVLTILCYTIGPISGGHFNPAISIAKLINKEISGEECVLYILAQVVGGFIGSFILGLITVQFTSLGANGIGLALRDSDYELTALSYVGASFVEIFLTFIFAFAVLYATGKKSTTGKATGLFVGGALTLVHLLGYNLTGTSVNPARSFAPAIVQMLGGDLEAAKLLPIFLAAPIAGAVLAAFAYRYFVSDEKNEEKQHCAFVKYIIVLIAAAAVVVAFLGFSGEFMTFSAMGTNVIVSGFDITFGNKLNGMDFYTVSVGNIISFSVMILVFIMFVIAAILGFTKKEGGAKILVLIGAILALISGILLIIAPTFATFSDNLANVTDYTEELTDNARFVYVMMFVASILGFVLFKFIKAEKKANATNDETTVAENNTEEKGEEVNNEASDNNAQELNEESSDNTQVEEEEKIESETEATDDTNKENE